MNASPCSGRKVRGSRTTVRTAAKRSIETEEKKSTRASNAPTGSPRPATGCDEKTAGQRIGRKFYRQTLALASGTPVTLRPYCRIVAVSARRLLEDINSGAYRTCVEANDALWRAT